MQLFTARLRSLMSTMTDVKKAGVLSVVLGTKPTLTSAQITLPSLSIRDGKISAIDTYMSDVDMLNAFFVPK
jgi:hypothetical protein